MKKKHRTVRTVTLRGNKFAIEYGSRYDGFCENPKGKNKYPKISINCEPYSRDEFETFLHEFLHACVFAKSEAVVSVTAEHMAKQLMRIGFRRLDPELLPEYDKRVAKLKATQNT